MDAGPRRWTLNANGTLHKMLAATEGDGCLKDAAEDAGTHRDA